MDQKLENFGKVGKEQELKSIVMNGVRSEKENMVKSIVMNGVKTEKVGELESCKINEEMRGQIKERLRKSSIKCLARHSREKRAMSEEVEEGSGRCDTAESRSERGNQRQNGHVEQHQYSTPERVNKKKKRIVQELHVGPAPVDASVVRSSRADAYQGRDHRQV